MQAECPAQSKPTKARHLLSIPGQGASNACAGSGSLSLEGESSSCTFRCALKLGGGTSNWSIAVSVVLGRWTPPAGLSGLARAVTRQCGWSAC
jgi:hypothetical protein